MKLKKKSLILIAFLLLIFLSVGYATLQKSLGISGLVNIKGSKVVTFNGNGGSVSTSTKRIVPNATYGELPTPERSEYEFLGWYTSETGGEKVTSESIVTNESNHTLYAHWIRTTLLFSGKGYGNYTISEGKLEKKEYSTDLDIIIESAGYTINAYCYNAFGGGHIYFTNNAGVSTDICSINGDEFSTTGTYKTTESGVLKLKSIATIESVLTDTNQKVKFRLDGYRITYDINGGIRSNAPPYSYTTIVPSGESITIPKTGNWVVKTGSEWVGFATTKDATESDVLTTLTPTKDVTLYAVYKPGLKYHTEGYTLFDDEGTISMRLQNSQHGSTKTIIDVPSGEFLVYYGVMSGANDGRVSFEDANGNETFTLNYSGKNNYGNKYVTGPGKLILQGTSLANFQRKSSSNDVGFYWDDNYAKITYNANGGSFVIKAMEQYGFKKETSVKLYVGAENGETIYRSGYYLLGFSTDKDATTAMYSPGQTITPTDNMTLYAIYSADTIL